MTHTTPELAALYAACVRHPDDTRSRLVYADMLDESGDEGDAHYASFIRLQCLQADRDGLGNPECQTCGGTGSVVYTYVWDGHNNEEECPYCVKWHRQIEEELGRLFWGRLNSPIQSHVYSRFNDESHWYHNAGLHVHRKNYLANEMGHLQLRRGMVEKVVCPSVEWWLVRGGCVRCGGGSRRLTAPDGGVMDPCNCGGQVVTNGRRLVEEFPILDVRPLDVSLAGGVWAEGSRGTGFQFELGTDASRQLPWDADERAASLEGTDMREVPGSARYWVRIGAIGRLPYLSDGRGGTVPLSYLTGLPTPEEVWRRLSDCLLHAVRS